MDPYPTGKGLVVISQRADCAVANVEAAVLIGDDERGAMFLLLLAGDRELLRRSTSDTGREGRTRLHILRLGHNYGQCGPLFRRPKHLLQAPSASTFCKHLLQAPSAIEFPEPGSKCGVASLSALITFLAASSTRSELP